MKKYSFLVPIAAAVAALIDANYSTALANEVSTSVLPVDQAGPALSQSSSFTIQTTADRVDSFVLARAEDGALFAQHESHASHSSHASHASHSSHTSGVSLA